MSRASRSATPNRAVRAPRSPLSVSSASTNEPPAGDTTPIAPAAESCCVCLERPPPAAQGAHAAVARCLATLLEQGDTFCPPPASTQLSWLSALGGSATAPPRKTASQRIGPPGATPSPSSWPKPRRRPRASAPPCQATEPCLRRPRLPMPEHIGQTSAPVPPLRPLTQTAPTTRGRSRAGSVRLPVPVISARTRRIFQTSPLRLERCCCRRQGPSLPAH